MPFGTMLAVAPVVRCPDEGIGVLAAAGRLEEGAVGDQGASDEEQAAGGLQIEGEPLAGHRVLQTADVEEVRELTSRMLAVKYRMEPLEPGARAKAKFNAVGLGDVDVAYLETGTPVRFESPEFGTFLVTIQLSGEMNVARDDERIISTPRQAVVFNPHGAVSGSWSGTPQLITGLSRAAVEAELEQQLGKSIVVPLSFDLGMDLRNPAAQSWLAALRLVQWECAGPGSVIRFPAVAKQLERLLVTELLFAQSHNYTEALLDPRPAAHPRAVKQAIAMIEANPEQWFGVADLASAVGVSVRCLQEGFRRSAGMPPMSYLREVRLARAHADLEEAEPDGVTVAFVANSWGFTHLGRFAAAYQKKYGVLPSETLRSEARRRPS